MAVFRIEKTRDYMVMSNHHLRNTDLSLKAKGLLSLIEVLQPVFGRAFDINDIILNTLGIIISTSIFIGIKKIIETNKAKSSQ